jgi:hypothetical protein
MDSAHQFDFSGRQAIQRGSTRRIQFAFKQTNGNSINLTGCTAIAGFKSAVNSVDQYDLTVTIDEPRTRGSVLLVIPGALTQGLPTGRYHWDLLITMANGDPWRPVFGALILQGGFTR